MVIEQSKKRIAAMQRERAALEGLRDWLPSLKAMAQGRQPLDWIVEIKGMGLAEVLAGVAARRRRQVTESRYPDSAQTSARQVAAKLWQKLSRAAAANETETIKPELLRAAVTDAGELLEQAARLEARARQAASELSPAAARARTERIKPLARKGGIARGKQILSDPAQTEWLKNLRRGTGKPKKSKK